MVKIRYEGALAGCKYQEVQNSKFKKSMVQSGVNFNLRQKIEPLSKNQTKNCRIKAYCALIFTLGTGWLIPKVKTWWNEAKTGERRSIIYLKEENSAAGGLLVTRAARVSTARLSSEKPVDPATLNPQAQSTPVKDREPSQGAVSAVNDQQTPVFDRNQPEPDIDANAVHLNGEVDGDLDEVLAWSLQNEEDEKNLQEVLKRSMEGVPPLDSSSETPVDPATLNPQDQSIPINDRDLIQNAVSPENEQQIPVFDEVDEDLDEVLALSLQNKEYEKNLQAALQRSIEDMPPLDSGPKEAVSAHENDTPLDVSNYVFAGVTQYNAGGSLAPSACTPLSVAFLALKTPASKEALTELISVEAPKWSGVEHYTVEDALKTYPNMQFLNDLPYLITKDHIGVGIEPQLNIEVENGDQSIYIQRDGWAYKKTFDYIAERGVAAGILTGNAMTIAFKKELNGEFEFFDPHGAQEITGGSGAYVRKCQTVDEAIEYLTLRFPPPFDEMLTDLDPSQDASHLTRVSFTPLEFR